MRFTGNRKILFNLKFNKFLESGILGTNEIGAGVSNIKH